MILGNPSADTKTTLARIRAQPGFREFEQALLEAEATRIRAALYANTGVGQTRDWNAGYAAALKEFIDLLTERKPI